MSQNGSGLSRRDVLKRIGLTAIVVGPGMSILNACATSGGDDKDTTGVDVNKNDSKNPFKVDATKPLNVVIFKGGLGDDYATKVHEPEYAQEFKGVKINHEGVVEIKTTLQPRFAGGSNVPDMVSNSGADMLDGAALVKGGQVKDLTDFWAAPSIDDPSKKLSETVAPGAVESGLFDGKPYMLNYVSSTYGLWYNAKLFAAKGWTIPTTFDDFKALCEKIKAAGIVPFGYAGANAAYYQYAVILISAAKIGGKQVLVDIDNLVDGAWTNDAVKQAAAAWAEIGAKYSDKSFLGLKHTVVQTKQNQDKLAFYPSGSWLENEQKDSTPASFEYAVMPQPSITAADKIPASGIRVAAGESYFVPSKSANPEGGLEYMRIMLSKEGAKGFTAKTGSLTIVAGTAEGATLSPGTASCLKLQKAATEANYVADSFFPNWYPGLGEAAFKETNNLMFKGGSADAFCANMQKAADKIKADSKINKQTRAS